VITEGNTCDLTVPLVRSRSRGLAMLAGLLPLVLAAAASLTVPAQAATFAPDPLPGVRLMWATQTAIRLGWATAGGAWFYSVDQLNGMQVRSGSEPGYYHTVTLTGLHPGWRYRCTVWSNPADGPGRPATRYVTLPQLLPPREYAYQWAEAQAGTPYVYGAEGHGGYDCSGLVRTAYQHAGIWLPRTTGQMLGDPVLQRVATPQQGDLVFFGSGHVELYDRQDWSFGAEDAGSSWYRWWPGNWWPTAFYRVNGAG
jgi:cell wall-associated NlpC family hydrolase